MLWQSIRTHFESATTAVVHFQNGKSQSVAEMYFIAINDVRLHQERCMLGDVNERKIRKNEFGSEHSGLLSLLFSL